MIRQIPIEAHLIQPIIVPIPTNPQLNPGQGFHHLIVYPLMQEGIFVLRLALVKVYDLNLQGGTQEE